MIIFLHGPDSFRSKQKLNDIIAGYEKANAALGNLLYIDAPVSLFSDFYGQFHTGSMFVKKKLVVVKNSFSNKDFQEKFLERIKDINDAKDIVVIYEEEKADERTKLLNYKKGVVTKEDVMLLVRPSIENYIFETIDSLASKNKKQAMVLLKNHINAGESPLYMLSMIAYQFRNFLVVKDALDRKVPYYLIAKSSGLHPFVVQKSMQLATRFSMENLQTIYRNIFEVDEAMKTGKIDPEMALEMLVAEL